MNQDGLDLRGKDEHPVATIPVKGLDPVPVTRQEQAAARPIQQPEREHAMEAVHRSEEHTSELQSPCNLVCRLLLEKKKTQRSLGVRFAAAAPVIVVLISNPRHLLP